MEEMRKIICKFQSCRYECDTFKDGTLRGYCQKINDIKKALHDAGYRKVEIDRQQMINVVEKMGLFNVNALGLRSLIVDELIKNKDKWLK